MEEFIADAALLAGRLTRQCDDAMAEQRAASTELQRAATDVTQSVIDGTAEISRSARAAVREALAQEIPAAIGAIAQTGDRLRELADQLEREQSSAGLRMRLLGWVSLGAFGLAAVAIVAGTAYAARHNMQRAERSQLRAEVLEALQKVPITSCEGQPCVKLQDGLPRWQKNDEYILVDVVTPPSVEPK